MDIVLDTIKAVTGRFPQVIPHLKGRALVIAVTGEDWETKDIGTYTSNLQALVRGLYNRTIDREFIGLVSGLMSVQLNEAKQAAYDISEVGAFGKAETWVENVIVSENSFIENFYNDIIKAREAGEDIIPLLARCRLWANRWLDVFNGVLQLIYAEFGERQEWILGDTKHCPTCEALNGIVAYAKEWLDMDIHPQRPPNVRLSCGGWACKCQLIPTSKRKTRNAVNLIRAATGA